MLCLIVFAYQDQESCGFGNSYDRFEHNPPTLKEIEKAQRQIEDNLGTKNVVIINCLPLSEDE